MASQPETEQRPFSVPQLAARWGCSEGLGLVDVEHGIEELEELQDIVERGPDWNTIDRITITLDRVCDEGLTIEQAGGASE